jgi:hypothetical protein
MEALGGRGDIHVFLVAIKLHRKQAKKSFASVGDQTPVVQSVLRHYTD